MRLAAVILSHAIAAAAAGFSASDFAEPPPNLAARLEGVVRKTSAFWNCSVSLSLKTAGWEVNVAHGSIDLLTGREATPADEYAWGSVTKLLTGSNILKLISEGAFGLDDEVMPFVDRFLAKMAKADPNQGFSSMADLWGKQNVSNTTFRKLLHMVSGVPDFDTATPCHPHPCADTDPLRADAYKRPAHSYTPPQLMKLPWVKHHWLHCKATWGPEPFCYSSTNFMLLGMVLAEHSGARSWEEYSQAASLPRSLQGRVRFAVRGAPSQYIQVHGYDRTSYNMPSGQYSNHDNFDVASVFSGWTASDFVSNVSTVANLAWEIFGPPHAIAPKRYAEMMAPEKGFYGLATQDMGYNTGRRHTEYGVAYGHMGATYGYQGLVAWAPALNLTLAVATNIETNDQQQPAMAFCLGYNEALSEILGKPTSCNFSTGGYYSGGCKCAPLDDSDIERHEDGAIANVGIVI